MKGNYTCHVREYELKKPDNNDNDGEKVFKKKRIFCFPKAMHRE